MAPVAVDGRYLARAVVDACAPVDGGAEAAAVAEIAENPLDVEAVHGDVVRAVEQQHAHPMAVVEKPTNEVGSQMPGGAGHRLNSLSRRGGRLAREADE